MIITIDTDTGRAQVDDNNGVMLDYNISMGRPTQFLTYVDGTSVNYSTGLANCTMTVSLMFDRITESMMRPYHPGLLPPGHPEDRRLDLQL